MIKLIKLVVKAYFIISGCLVLLALLDKYAGKILLTLDKDFRHMLLGKLKRGDIQATKEKVLYILKPANPNGVVEQKVN